ncbi:MAG TPA: helix-turn-helix domain-containing protein [Anaerovoracaceae bacterium]|nr:helix-turn-helix domain-containing protein [Anaerovoracaceae bacterium]
MAANNESPKGTEIILTLEFKSAFIVFMFSQRVFAEVLGVSPKTIEAWEAGKNHPDGSSSRMLQLLQKDPDLI